jgi:glyoxylase-like metal-dependent hydrolase (beta-lactamase superfamily II)/rhodanese-related sulfurtransferase
MTEVVAGPGRLGTTRLSIVTYEAPGLGDRSYLVHDGDKATVIDPQRDPAPYLATAAELGVGITLVLETHVHNDYVSGGLALSRKAGATYGVASGEQVEFSAEREPLEEGDVLAVGQLRLSVLATPGHTPHHLSFLIEDDLGTKAVFSGGSLLPGATGRTDLFGPERARELAEAQWRSVRRLLHELPAGTAVLPTHGFGSFCASGDVPAAAAEATIATERRLNPAARLDQGAFVERLLRDLPPVPSYYRHMAPINRVGATGPAGGPVPVVVANSLPGLLSGGAVLVDLRRRGVFAQAHRRGALNIEVGPGLATYLGWLVPFSAPLVVVSKGLDDVLEARRLLAGIGREALAGWVPDDFIGSLGPEAGAYEVHGFRELAERGRERTLPTIVDVRFGHEWRRGHIRGARHVPLPELWPAIPAMPRDEEVWVHCAAGFRAAIAASILSEHGLRPVLVDDAFDNAAAAGLDVVSG